MAWQDYRADFLVHLAGQLAEAVADLRQAAADMTEAELDPIRVNYDLENNENKMALAKMLKFAQDSKWRASEGRLKRLRDRGPDGEVA